MQIVSIITTLRSLAMHITMAGQRTLQHGPTFLATREIDLTAISSQIQRIEMMNIQCSNQVDTLSRGSDGTPGYATLPEMTIVFATYQSHVDIRARFSTLPTIQDDFTGPVVTRVSMTHTHPLGYSAPIFSGTTIEVLTPFPHFQLPPPYEELATWYEPQHVRGRAVPYRAGNNATPTLYCTRITLAEKPLHKAISARDVWWAIYMHETKISVQAHRKYCYVY
ncbi:hypothetical protein EV421DRAFT_1740089 [Armillaria borealis]|uniref:Uncharacterized protein n=1 Tax=Armillaria borealis TaxID=47425 RepID=A0AA39J4T4_9AGAR|nr:hypothetical protein EV421DRAFT_1740089 [Armillaria borealis]